MEKISDKRKKKKIIFITLAVVVLAISVASFFVDGDALLAAVGLEGAYAILFVMSATAGVSVFTATGFFAFFGAFLQLDVDPLLSGIIAGLGVSLGDYVIFALARLAAQSSSTVNDHKHYQKLCRFVERLPDWGVYAFTFFYTAFIPIPNDILMAILGALQVKTWLITTAMVIGNCVLMVLIALGVMQFFH